MQKPGSHDVAPIASIMIVMIHAHIRNWVWLAAVFLLGTTLVLHLMQVRKLRRTQHAVKNVSFPIYFCAVFIWVALYEIFHHPW